MSLTPKFFFPVTGNALKQVEKANNNAYHDCSKKRFAPVICGIIPSFYLPPDVRCQNVGGVALTL